MHESEASWQASASLRRMRSLLLARVVEEKLHRLKRAVKANFNPNQPRVPAGNPDGGQWTGTGGGAGTTSNPRVAQTTPRGGGRRTGSDAEATPAQEARLTVEEAQARDAIRRVREIDPTWSPNQSLTAPDSIEGEISRAQGQRQDTEDRLIELAKQPADRLIDAYRRQQGLDLLGEPTWSREENSVAVCKVGEKPFIGVNSQALTYTHRDSGTAERLRDSLIRSYPTSMSTTNIGQFPNNAVFHAETTCLLRAARANGGTLKGQTVEVHVDREMCRSCLRLLPLIGLELGNPTVTFTVPSGRVRTMRDGTWIK